MKKPNTNTNTNTQNGNYTKINDVVVLRVNQFSNGNVVADLELNGIRVYGVRVVEGKNGDFLSFPQRQGKNGKYYHIAYVFLSPTDQAAIIGEIERKLNGGE